MSIELWVLWSRKMNWFLRALPYVGEWALVSSNPEMVPPHDEHANRYTHKSVCFSICFSMQPLLASRVGTNAIVVTNMTIWEQQTTVGTVEMEALNAVVIGPCPCMLHEMEVCCPSWGTICTAVTLPARTLQIVHIYLYVPGLFKLPQNYKGAERVTSKVLGWR